MYKTIIEWVDYIDEGAVSFIQILMCLKELSLEIKVVEGEGEYLHKILFQNVASVYFNGGDGDIRLEKQIQRNTIGKYLNSVITRKESEIYQIL